MKYFVGAVILTLTILQVMGQGLSGLSGPYLGQDPPENSAEVFAPGIISTGEDEILYGIYCGGNRIVFDRVPDGFTDWENEPVYLVESVNGKWTSPVLTGYTGMQAYRFNSSVKEGEKIVIPRWRTGSSGNIEVIDLYALIRTERGWTEPAILGAPVNSAWFDSWPSLSEVGVLYFFSNRPGGFGKADIYRAVPSNGRYLAVENLGPAINFGEWQHDPCISADGKTLIYSSLNPNSLGEDDLYVSFLMPDNTWASPVNLGPGINSSAADNRPYLTEDGQYLFFTSSRNGSLDIFWAGISSVESHRGKSQ